MSNENTQQEQSNEQTKQPLTLYTDSLDSIPEALHSFYEKQDDGYKLNVKNAVPSAKLDEFRTNNRKLNAELEEIRKQMSYVDMDEYNRLKDQYSKEKSKGSIPETDVEQTLAKRTAEMKADFEKKLAEMTDNYSKTNQKLSTVLPKIKMVKPYTTMKVNH
jgi:exonuclease VII large subunit